MTWNGEDFLAGVPEVDVGEEEVDLDRLVGARGRGRRRSGDGFDRFGTTAATGSDHKGGQ
ncbi:MAG: hypothetical protein R3320_06875 [Nitriliruptorales bacterium]|nr:hypothetical protein [Nitriliruptorales bacterium]